MNIEIPLQIYPYDLMVSIGESDIELDKSLDRLALTENEIKFVKWTSGNNRGKSVIFDSNVSFIRLRSLKKTPEDLSILAHEVFHIVTFLMERIGMKLEVMTSCEAYAYLVQYITKQILLKIK